MADKSVPETKKIWMRIGVTVPVTDDELFDIMEKNHQEYMSSFPPGRCGRADGMDDYDMNDQEAQKFLERATADGESYIPDCCFDPYLEWWEKERERRKTHEKTESV